MSHKGFWKVKALHNSGALEISFGREPQMSMRFAEVTASNEYQAGWLENPGHLVVAGFDRCRLKDGKITMEGKRDVK